MRKNWDELDLFRGYAGIFMLVNHAGVAWLQRTSAAGYSPSGILTSIGSFAPVLFFFATGIGYGLQTAAGRRTRHDYGFLNKICILFVCDQFLAWQYGRFWGFDFLGFIAVSMLALEVLRRARRPVLIATVAAIAAFALRFAVGPFVGSILDNGEIAPLVDRAFGRIGTPGIAYPLLPWICFPLTGFLVGFFAQRHESKIDRPLLRLGAVFAGLALLSFGAGGYLVANDHPLMRWGSMSASYFCLSAGVLALTLLLALGALRVSLLAPFTRRVSLRGMSSLAVVPLHYFVVHLFGFVLGRVSDEVVFLAACIFLVAVVFPIARLIAAAGDWATRMSGQGVVWFALVITATSSGALLLLGIATSELASLSISCVGQLCLCVLLVVRLPRRARRAAV